MKITKISKHIFNTPVHFGPAIAGAWTGHAPFAFWLIEQLKPSCVVELGTHSGFSYFVFCEAVQTYELTDSIRCFAVDTWQGDDHSGKYDESVFEMVQSANEQYSSFSTLIRSTFTGAVSQFADGSIDLLHIDGSHRYEEVKADFNAYKSKLSDRAIVLFHDTSVMDRDFGVKQFVQELEQEYPVFYFEHSNGLGVLAFGKEIRQWFDGIYTALNENDLILHALFKSAGEQLLRSRELMNRTEQLNTSVDNLKKTRNVLDLTREALDKTRDALNSTRENRINIKKQCG